MFFSATLFLSALVASASASTVVTRQANYPACALLCISDPSLYDGCGQDFACLCESFTFVSGTEACFRKTCSDAEVTESLDLATQACNSVGVTDRPTDPTAASSVAPETSEAASSVAASISGSAASVTASLSSLVASATDSVAPAPSDAPANGASSSTVSALVAVAAVFVAVL